jgi:restriction endonuclease S subunit
LICFNDGKLKRLAGQTAVPIIGKTDFQQLQMAYPSDLAEQQQIAERLSAIDAKIADELAVIAKYRKVKAGLMARLLTPPPGVEIVDGGV